MTPNKIACTVTAGLLFAACLTLPYGYYTFLRIAVTACCVYAAFQPYRLGQPLFTVTHLGLALLFNPVIKVGFSKAVWLPIDIATGCFLLASAALVVQKKEAL